MRLRELRKNDDHQQVVLEVLSALEKLLELDHEYPSEFEGEASVGFQVDSFRGFDEMEEL